VIDALWFNRLCVSIRRARATARIGLGNIHDVRVARRSLP
jgi:hypothetical protein